jgi:hypothetical protein
MKTIVRLAVSSVCLLISGSFIAAQSPSAPTGLDALNAFAGKWIVTGEMKDSAYSKAMKLGSDETICSWSANHGFLICDQLIHAPDGMLNQLSLYTYNEKDHSYAFFGFSRDNPRARTPKFNIEDNLWTYSNEFDDGAKHIRIRTTNKFDSPNHVIWRSEFSDDNGAHWTLMGEGTDTRAN